MNYFIKDGIAQAGPFALTDIVRKIRNGSLTDDMMVVGENEAEPVLAAEHPELKSFFREVEAGHARQQSSDGMRSLSFMPWFMRGWVFLTEHHETVVFGAIALGFTLVTAAIAYYLFPGFIGSLFPVITGMAAMFSISTLSLAFLRLTRGQTVDPHTLFDKMKRHALPLIYFSAMAGIFVSLGMFLLVVPGLLVLAFYSFTPFLIAERNMDFWEAMETSRKTILREGRPLFEVVFGFAVVNFMGGILFVLPLLITLPVTYGALAALYDETSFDEAA